MLKRLIFVLFLFAGSVFSFANPVQWTKAVEKGDLDVLEQAQKQGKLPSSWQMLLKALKVEDGDSAARLYDRITDLYPTEEPSSIAYKRLRDYAAMGGVLHVTVTNPTPEVPVAVIPEVKQVVSTPTAKSTTPIVKPALPSSPPPVPSGKYAAQFGAYSSEQKAQQIANNLRNSGFASECVPLNRNDQTLYRVWGGRFATRQEATQCVIQVQERFPQLNATIVEIP